MRKLIPLLVLAALAAVVAIPAAADSGPKRDKADKRHHDRGRCGEESRSERGYVVIFDGSRRCFERWRYSGGASMTLQRDGTLRSGPGAPGLGMLWYAARPYADFSLRLQFRDDAPVAAQRANSGVLVRFPPPHPPVPGCPTTFNGNEQNNPAWVAVNCGHEVQINDSPDGPPNDPRKTGSIYGFADLNATQARTTPKGVWNDLEIRVEKQHYTVFRNGVKINEYENLPGVPFPGRPNDPDSSSRGLVGYVGLQAHGAPQDVVSFRNIRIRDLSDRD
jgi:hypothetical protein